MVSAMLRKVLVVFAVVAGALAGIAGIPTVEVASATSMSTPPLPGPPVGSFDAVSVRFDDHAVVSGWAADPDRAGRSINVALYLGGHLVVETPTGDARPDVAAAVSWAGPSTGWHVTPSDSPEWSSGRGSMLCAYARNPGGGGKVLLGCRDLRVQGNTPFNPAGALDAATIDPGRVRLQGWAADPDGDPTTQIRVAYDGATVLQSTAALPRPDVAAALGLSPTSGFDLILPVLPGPHVICVVAQNTGLHGEGNSTVGCVTPTIPGVQSPGPHDPRGNLDAIDAIAVGQTETFRWVSKGWAYDPDSGGPINVRVRTLGKAPAYRPPNNYTLYDSVYATGQPRADVQNVYPAAGPSSGFDGSHVTLRNPEMTLMCAYAVNVGAGTNQLIGCIEPRHL
jgi:hypothetical protein